MKAGSINKEWANSVTYAEFCKDANIKKLDAKTRKKLYTEVTKKSKGRE